MYRPGSTTKGWVIAIVSAIVPLVAIAGNWTYTSSTSPMDNTVSRFASLESSDVVEVGFPYRNHRPELLLRTKNGRDLNVLLMFSGQAQSGLDGGHIRVKFDSGAARTWTFSRPEDHGRTGLIFIDNERAFLGQLVKSKNVLIELPYYSEGKRTFGFDVTGLDVTRLDLKLPPPPRKETKKTAPPATAVVEKLAEKPAPLRPDVRVYACIREGEKRGLVRDELTAFIAECTSGAHLDEAGQPKQ